MTEDQFQKLKHGDLVRSKPSGQEYMVTMSFGDRVTAVATADLTNPIEWELISTVTRTPRSAP